MQRKTLLWWAFALTLYSIFLLTSFFGGLWLARSDPLAIFYDDFLPPFGEAWQLLELSFYGPLPPAEVRVRGAARGLLETLGDPYTVLLDPQPASQELQRLSGSYGDVGLDLWWGEGARVGITPYPTGPAADAGLQSGDYLLSVDGTPLTGMQGLDEIAWLLQGEVDSQVILEILREPQPPFSVTLTRAEVLHPSVQWRFVDEAPHIGYLQISLFTYETHNEIEAALTALQDEGITALILDVRGNGGGVLGPLPRISGLFLGSGKTVYYEINRRGETRATSRGTALYTGPLALLVDDNTASASEIFAAALQENQRAWVIGEPTRGKGLIQNLYNLQDGSTLHVTVSVWLTPERNALHDAGIVPDQIVADVSGRDACMDAALTYLQSQ